MTTVFPKAVGRVLKKLQLRFEVTFSNFRKISSIPNSGRELVYRLRYTVTLRIVVKVTQPNLMFYYLLPIRCMYVCKIKKLIVIAKIVHQYHWKHPFR